MLWKVSEEAKRFLNSLSKEGASKLMDIVLADDEDDFTIIIGEKVYELKRFDTEKMRSRMMSAEEAKKLSESRRAIRYKKAGSKIRCLIREAAEDGRTFCKINNELWKDATREFKSELQKLGYEMYTSGGVVMVRWG